MTITYVKLLTLRRSIDSVVKVWYHKINKICRKSSSLSVQVLDVQAVHFHGNIFLFVSTINSRIEIELVIKMPDFVDTTLLIPILGFVIS